MLGLLNELDGCRDAALRGHNSWEEAQDQMDRLINAGSTVLNYYASLPPAVARSILSDDRAREFRDETLNRAKQCNTLATNILYNLREKREAADAVLHKLRASSTPRDQLSRAVSSVAKHYVALMEWWEKKLRRCERMRSVCAATANLPSATAEMREGEQAALRVHTGWAANLKVMVLQSRVALAQLKIEPLASTFETAVREILIGEDRKVRLLGTFISDVFPAFHSTRDAVMSSEGRPLDAEHRAVLEGVMERLSEFGLALHDMLAKLGDDRTGAGLPLELLGQIVDDAWITAHEVMHFLELQPKSPAIIASPAAAGAAKPAGTAGTATIAETLAQQLQTKAIIAPPADARAAIPADTASEAAGAQGTAVGKKRKAKGKDRQAAGAGTSAAGASSSAAGQPEPQVAANDGDPAPAAKVVVLSDLGTKKLVSAEEAPDASASAAAARLAIWQAPASEQMLARLAELLKFDLAGQQKAVSQARQMKPENAEHVVDTVVERLQTQAAEMQACLAAFKQHDSLLRLSPSQVPKVHEDTEQLKRMLGQAQGLAKALKEQKATITIECMKTYAFPSQKYLEHLRQAKELTPADPPQPLRGEPGTLFEIRLQPKALRNGAKPKPMWVHIHTKESVHAGQLATLNDADFVACHVKSNEQRGHNRQWQDARAAIGHENVVIHRGKLTPAFCKSLLTGGLSGYPRHPLAAVEHRSTPAARHAI
ncbi:hypothetical protein LHFGNBLO_006421 (plasmid) [Mesorhizobium sp. AR10]|uniref:hypothetical protein n=1 Tax=Mesorhizobium sp. AR10 TaxID=2865839 RepID=UPI0021605172|nr:hypothetical protein [Mesorhizobium sp. AR10]UVK35610.1 hypothetical protein LHFGNBLO_006421 [Mesorhizobium sp. AR10]